MGASAGLPRARFGLWSWNSLTTRLGAWFALLSAVLLAVVGVMLCHTLEAELLSRDVAELMAKTAQLRGALGDFESVPALRARQADFFGAVYDTQRQAIVVADRDGRALLASRELMVPPDLLMGFAAQPGRAPQTVQWNQHGDDWCAVLAWGALGHRSIATSAAASVVSVVLVVALNRSSTNLMLDQFYRQLILMLVGGGLITSAIGFAVAYHGLRPLRQIDATASAITADRLTERLDLSRAPDEVLRLGASFNAMLARLQESFRRLSEFSSDLAHELRTPLNTLLGQTHVALSRTRAPHEYQDVLESNAEELERLRKMTEDMLFLAKADDRETRLDWQTFEVREELDKVADYFAVVAEDRAVKVEVAGAAPLRADRRLVQRALNNLFANAVRHAPSGSAVKVWIDASSDGAVQLAIANAGPGIAAEHLPRVFDRFFRTDPSRPDSTESNGLGLAIVQSIMRMHGGLAAAESVAGGLTTFTLRFPPPARQP
jgi:two-component system, OmpR family, heavy metal sensor histidine kinase CusS